jgi:hypothetical protein
VFRHAMDPLQSAAVLYGQVAPDHDTEVVDVSRHQDLPRGRCVYIVDEVCVKEEE